MDKKAVEGMSLSLGPTPTPDQSSTSWFLDPDTCIDDYIVGRVCRFSEQKNEEPLYIMYVQRGK
jgi:hypothetical protein